MMQLNEDTTITLDYNDILKVFANTKLIKMLNVKQITGWAEEIESVLEDKLK